MSPLFSSNYKRYRCWINAVFFCECVNIKFMRISFIKFSNFKNLFFGMFSKPIFCASSIRILSTSFSNPIPVVIKSSSYKQMAWPYARRIIALVTYIHSFWNRAIRQLPRYSLRSSCFSFPTIRAITVACCSNPYPTSRSLFDVRPEWFLFSSSHVFNCTFASTKMEGEF